MSRSPPVAECVVSCQNVLGESVFWSAATQTVGWIDGVEPALWQFHPDNGRHESRRIDVPAPLGMIAATSDPRLLVMAHRSGVALYDLHDGHQTAVADPECGRAGIGYNDAKVDPSGCLWLGTYDDSEVEPRACLWRLQHGRAPALAESGVAVFNGPAFSPDGKIIYVSDSIGRRILAYDIGERALSGRRVFVQLRPEDGLPDGLTVDAEGALWCAHWDGACVSRYAPSGEQVLRIALPVPRVTSVAFGGAQLDTLYITTARYGLSAEQLALAPLAGGLFAVRPKVHGIAPALLPLPFVLR